MTDQNYKIRLGDEEADIPERMLRPRPVEPDPPQAPQEPQTPREPIHEGGNGGPDNPRWNFQDYGTIGIGDLGTLTIAEPVIGGPLTTIIAQNLHLKSDANGNVVIENSSPNPGAAIIFRINNVEVLRIQNNRLMIGTTYVQNYEHNDHLLIVQRYDGTQRAM